MSQTRFRLAGALGSIPPWSRRAVTRFLENSRPRRRVVGPEPPLVVLRRPGIAGPADRRQGDGGIHHQGVGLQAGIERGEIGQRLQGRAGLAHRLGDAVELAQRVGEAAGHREDPAGLVLHHQGRALDRGPDADLRAQAALARTDLHADHVVDLQLAPGDAGVEDGGPAIGEADLHAAAPGLQHHRHRPMHVVEHRAGALERQKPGRLLLRDRRDLLATTRLGVRFGVHLGIRLGRIRSRSRHRGRRLCRPLRCRSRGLDPADAVGEVEFGPREDLTARGALVIGEPVLESLLDGALQARIDRRADGQRPGGQRIHSREGAGLPIEEIHHVEAGIAPRGLDRLQPEIGLDRRAHLGLGNRALFLEAGEHVGAPLPRPVRILVGAVEIRPLGHAGEERGLRQGELPHRLPEIALRRHLDAVGAAAEIDAVEIEPENLRLREDPLQPRRDDHLADLALVGDVVADREVLDHLLGDGRTTRRTSRRSEIGDEGADHAALVDAVMGLEALVLGGDEGLLHQRRNRRDRHDDAAPVRLGGLGEGLAGAVEDPGHAGQRLVAQGLGAGQVLGGVVVELDHRLGVEGRVRRVLAFAELLVARVQLVQVEPVQDLRGGRPGDGGRILHRGGDQLVEVDVLDVEGLAHVGAAVAQQAHNLGPIGGWIELRPDRLRPGRDLAQGQGGREQLDQDGVHTGRVRGTRRGGRGPFGSAPEQGVHNAADLRRRRTATL